MSFTRQASCIFTIQHWFKFEVSKLQLHEPRVLHAKIEIGNKIHFCTKIGPKMSLVPCYFHLLSFNPMWCILSIVRRTGTNRGPAASPPLPNVKSAARLNACSTKVLLHFFSQACPNAQLKCIVVTQNTFRPMITHTKKHEVIHPKCA